MIRTTDLSICRRTRYLRINALKLYSVLNSPTLLLSKLKRDRIMEKIMVYLLCWVVLGVTVKVIIYFHRMTESEILGGVRTHSGVKHANRSH